MWTRGTFRGVRAKDVVRFGCVPGTKSRPRLPEDGVGHDVDGIRAISDEQVAIEVISLDGDTACAKIGRIHTEWSHRVSVVTIEHRGRIVACDLYKQVLGGHCHDRSGNDLRSDELRVRKRFAGNHSPGCWSASRLSRSRRRGSS